MGEKQKKYHVTDDGDIFRINDDGSFTSIGNAEKMSGSKSEESADSATNTVSSNDESFKTSKQHNSRKRLWVICALAFLLSGAAILLVTNISSNTAVTADVLAADSVVSTNIPVETSSLELMDSASDYNLSPEIVDPINNEKKEVEKSITESPQAKPLDMPKSANDDYTPQLACGQMEGPDNFYVLFPDGKTHLCSAHKQRIDRMLQNLNTYSDYIITVDGYCSSFSGTYASNMEDARLRVNSIVSYLKSKGVSENSINFAVYDYQNDDFGPYGHVSIMVE